MTSSPTGSHASLYKSAGAVQSPQSGGIETHSPPSTRDVAALPTPPSLSSKDDSGAIKGLSNGGGAADSSSIQNESEAETEILSEDDRQEPNTRTTKIKKEQEPEDDVTMVDAHSSGAITVRGRSVRHSSPNTERRPRNANGDDVKHETTNGRRRRSASESPHRTTTSRSSHPSDTINSRASPSVRASASPAPHGTDRIKSSPGSRKRKAREDQLLRASEPPRQKHKSSRSTNQPLPSPSAAHSVRSHRRSASTQSAVPQKRALREVSVTKYSSRDQDSDSEFTSDANDGSENSPYPPTVTLTQSRSKRLSNKPLTSPTRAIPPKRKNPLDKYGASELSKACERGELDEVKQEYDLHPELLDLADNAGVTPLAKAALNGHDEVVEFLLGKNCKVNCQTRARETPLMDAVENGHLQVVKILIAHGANPHHQNEDGHRALDLIDNECDDALTIERELKKAMRNYAGDDTVEPSASQTGVATQPSTRKDLFHVDPSRANLRSYSAKGDAVAVSEILVSIKPDLSCVVAAARGGHETVLSLLLASAAEDFKRDPDPTKHEETPLLAAIGRGHFGVLKLLLEQDNFNPTRRTRDGKTYFQVAQDIRGPRWEKEVELLKKYYEAYRAKHPGKGVKKRTPATSAIPVSKKPKVQEMPLQKREASSSPRLAAKTTSPDLKPASKTTADDLPKQRGRYIMKREISSSREQAQRKRRVVDEDSDEDSENQVSRPASREHTFSKKIANEDKSKLNARRKSSSSTGKPELLEKKRKTRQIEDKSTTEARDVPATKQQRTATSSAQTLPAIDAPPPPPPPRETTPESVKEERRLEAERLAREAEERRIQAEREAREQRLAVLPPTIKRACELGSKRPLHRNGRELGVTEVHLPIHAVILDPDPFDPSSSKDDRWCMSFQAVGLLGLREPDLSIRENWSGQTRTVTPEQRSRFRVGYNLQRLAQDFIFPLPGEEGWDGDRGKKEAEAAKEAEEKFALMPLVWVKLEDVALAAEEAEWLRGVEVTIWERSLAKKKSSNCGSLRAKFRKDVKKCEESPLATPGDVEMAHG